MNELEKEFNLYDVMQNVALSALACHSFTLGYYKVAKNKDGCPNYPKLVYVFFVLPIVYHKSTMETFKSSQQLYTAISNNKEITLGLHERANKMSPQTFDALNLAFSKKVLSYNVEEKSLEILRGFQSEKIKIDAILGHENKVKIIQDSAYKLGNIFAKNDEKNIQLELNIRF
jgi:hypothetical protein